MRTISDKTFDEERALYGENDLCVRNCLFEGPADGESAFKECTKIVADNCRFSLRYPFWHNLNLEIRNCEMYSTCRAPLWYCNSVRISDSKLLGTKALRECSDIRLENCTTDSSEFGWFCHDIVATNVTSCGEYFMLRSHNLQLTNLTLNGKYSFQYIKDATIRNCTLDTKDAFWHAENITVTNCTVKGEYLGWYSKNLVFENCKIIGTQPLCYCDSLKLIDCEMIDCDLAFEKSYVQASLTSPIVSIKNPEGGKIILPCAGEIILDCKTDCEIVQTATV